MGNMHRFVDDGSSQTVFGGGFFWGYHTDTHAHICVCVFIHVCAYICIDSIGYPASRLVPNNALAQADGVLHQS